MQSAPYHSGPRVRKFQRDEIDKMQVVNVAEPDETGWAAQILIALKPSRKIELYASTSIV